MSFPRVEVIIAAQLAALRELVILLTDASPSFSTFLLSLAITNNLV